jgi:hypothetical protein
MIISRADVGNQEGRRKKKTNIKDDLSGIQHPIFQGLTQKEMLDRKVISKAFKDAEIKEIQVSEVSFNLILNFFKRHYLPK